MTCVMWKRLFSTILTFYIISGVLAPNHCDSEAQRTQGQAVEGHVTETFYRLKLSDILKNLPSFDQKLIL